MNDQTPHTEYHYVNLPSPPEPVPEAPLTWRDGAGPLAAMVLAALFWRTFAFEYMLDGGGYGPGLGVFVFTAVYYAAVLWMLGRRPTRDGGFLMGASLALALSCALYAHPGFTVLNCFLILGLSAMAAFALSGQSRFSAFTLAAVPEAVRLSVLALFTRIDRPFRAAGRLGRDRRGDLGRAVLTVLGTLALLAVVLALLASADMVFGSFFDGLRRWLDRFALGPFLWRLLRWGALAVFLASALCFIREPVPAVHTAERAPARRRALPFLLPVLLLDGVYLIFCAVQLRYLFGGAEAAAMAGGWAEYARTGFFQLAAVAAINLVLCVLSGKPDRLTARGGLALRLGSAVMLVLTAVILASAAYRMHLYIAAFGLSVLRLMTLWGMVVIGVGILLAGWKLYQPGFRFYPAFFGFALTAWCLFCLSGPAGRVADYNVDAYLDGRLSSVDVDYLYELTPDAAPALRRLADAGDRASPAAGRYWDQMARETGDDILWTQWKLSFRRLE